MRFLGVLLALVCIVVFGVGALGFYLDMNEMVTADMLRQLDTEKLDEFVGSDMVQRLMEDPDIRELLGEYDDVAQFIADHPKVIKLLSVVIYAMENWGMLLIAGAAGFVLGLMMCRAAFLLVLVGLLVIVLGGYLGYLVYDAKGKGIDVLALLYLKQVEAEGFSALAYPRLMENMANFVEHYLHIIGAGLAVMVCGSAIKKR